MTQQEPGQRGVIRDVAGNPTDGFVCNVFSNGALYPDCPVGIPHQPQVGDVVALLTVDRPGIPWIVGCTTPRPVTLDVPQITIVPSAPGGGWSELTAVYGRDGDDTQPTLQFVRPVTPTPPTSGRLAVPAVNSHTWDGINGWREGNRDVYQGSGAAVGFNTVSKGLWFYPSVAALLPGATVTRLRVTVHRDARGGKADSVPVRFCTHGYAAQPGGEPSFLDVYVGPSLMLSWGATNTFDLPATWGQALVDGTVAGIAITSTATDDYSIYLGPDRDGTSGQLTFDY